MTSWLTYKIGKILDILHILVIFDVFFLLNVCHLGSSKQFVVVWHCYGGGRCSRAPASGVNNNMATANQESCICYLRLNLSFNSVVWCSTNAMASVDHKQYVKNYLKSKKDGARHQESLAIRWILKFLIKLCFIHWLYYYCTYCISHGINNKIFRLVSTDMQLSTPLRRTVPELATERILGHAMITEMLNQNHQKILAQRGPLLVLVEWCKAQTPDQSLQVAETKQGGLWPSQKVWLYWVEINAQWQGMLPLSRKYLSNMFYNLL